jgi:hypothetical protein
LIHYSKRHDKSLTEQERTEALEHYHQCHICTVMDAESRSNKGFVQDIMEHFAYKKLGQPFDAVRIMTDGLLGESFTDRRPALFAPWSKIEAVVVDELGLRLRMLGDRDFIPLLHSVYPEDLAALRREWAIALAKGSIPTSVALVIDGPERLAKAPPPKRWIGKFAKGVGSVLGVLFIVGVIANILEEKRPCMLSSVSKVVDQQVNAKLTKIQTGANVTSVLGTALFQLFGAHFGAPDFRLFYTIHPATAVSETDTKASCMATVDVDAKVSGTDIGADSFNVPFALSKANNGSWLVNVDTTAFDK